MVFNFVGTKVRGVPLYPFLTWESIPEGIIICILIIGVAVALFNGVGWGINNCNRQRIAKTD
jgi:hypothetical protein